MLRTRLSAVIFVGAMAIALSAAGAQIVIDRDNHAHDLVEREMEADYLKDWNRHREEKARREFHRSGQIRFGPRDAIRLVQRGGYHVRDVEDVGERFLVHATRGHDRMLVSVSRAGEITGVVHDR